MLYFFDAGQNFGRRWGWWLICLGMFLVSANAKKYMTHQKKVSAFGDRLFEEVFCYRPRHFYWWWCCIISGKLFGAFWSYKKCLLSSRRILVKRRNVCGVSSFVKKTKCYNSRTFSLKHLLKTKD